MKMVMMVFSLLAVCFSAFSLQYQITNYSGVIAGCPSWSPDGSKIAYYVFEEGKFDIWIVSSTGGGTPTRITNSANNNRCPAWSPDGTKIAFMNNTGASFPYQLRYVTLATGEETVVADGYLPHWSPDGKFLIFARGNNTEANIWKRELSTGIETQLTFTTGIEQSPDWSNNGQTIIYNVGNYNPTIWTISCSGGNSAQLPIEIGYSPRWSPDDALIAYSADNYLGGYSIYVYKLNDHSILQVTSGNTEHNIDPDWSPDGSKIAYTRSGNIWITTYGTAVEAISLGQLKSLYR